MLLEIRYAYRMLRNTPAFTLIAGLILAVGIGANTAVFSALNTLRGLAHTPVLLPDGRTLIYTQRGRDGIAVARRRSTQAGDLSFVDITQVVLDGDLPLVFGLTLSCDGGYLLYGVDTGAAIQPRRVQLLSLEPLQLSASEPFDAPLLPSDFDLRLAEGDRCDALYLTSGGNLHVSEPVSCRTWTCSASRRPDTTACGTSSPRSIDA